MSFALVPGLFFILWLALVAYGIVLATRLVSAVEQIARAMIQRVPQPPRP